MNILISQKKNEKNKKIENELEEKIKNLENEIIKNKEEIKNKENIIENMSIMEKAYTENIKGKETEVYELKQEEVIKDFKQEVNIKKDKPYRRRFGKENEIKETEIKKPEVIESEIIENKEVEKNDLNNQIEPKITKYKFNRFRKNKDNLEEKEDSPQITTEIKKRNIKEKPKNSYELYKKEDDKDEINTSIDITQGRLIDDDNEKKIEESKKELPKDNKMKDEKEKNKNINFLT